MLTWCNNESLGIQTVDAVQDENQKFVSLCNRGGLIKPCDVVFITCIHAWSLYAFIFDTDELSKMLLSSANPRAVFVQVFTRELQKSTCTETLRNETCQSGCSFKDNLEQIALATFNIKAKNYVSAARDSLRPQKKRQGNHKKSKTAKKAKKLSST